MESQFTVRNGKQPQVAAHSGGEAKDKPNTSTEADNLAKTCQDWSTSAFEAFCKFQSSPMAQDIEMALSEQFPDSVLSPTSSTLSWPQDSLRDQNETEYAWNHPSPSNTMTSCASSEKHALRALSSNLQGLDMSVEEQLECTYLAHYDKFVSKGLSRSFLSSVQAHIHHPSVRTAVMALSALDLALIQCTRVEGKGKGYMVRQNHPQARRHLHHSLESYERLLQQLSQFQDTDLENSQVRLLLISTFCSYFEMMIGNSQGFCTQVNASRSFVQAHHDLISRSSEGRDLLSAWTQAHQHFQIFRRCHLHPCEIDLREPTIHKLMQELADSAGTVLTLYCNAELIDARMIIDACVRQPEDDTCATMTRAYEMYFASVGDLPDFDDILRMPREFLSRADMIYNQGDIRDQLDRWRQSRKPEDLLHECSGSSSPGGSSMSGIDPTSALWPLRFQSNTAAINYLYYAAARFFVSQDAHQQTKFLTSEEPATPWAIMVLRIIWGLDFADCSRKALYSINPMTVLWSVAQRYPTRGFLDHILDQLFPYVESQITYGLMCLVLIQCKNTMKLLRDLVDMGLNPALVHLVDIRGLRDFQLWAPCLDVKAIIYARQGRGPMARYEMNVNLQRGLDTTDAGTLI